MEPDMGRQRLHKQIGCVTGFFQIFGRQHAINGKRLHHHRSPTVDYSSELDRSVQSSSSVSIDLDDLNGKSSPLSIKSSKRCPMTPEATKTPLEATTPVKTPPPSVGCGYEFREMSRSTWKLRESPRLSLDSRSTTYGSKPIQSDEGVEINQRRSTSVIARLMGLETLPELTRSKKPSPDQLTRSASESRVCSDLFTSRLIEGFDSCQKQSNITKTEAAAAAKSSNCKTLDNVVTTQQQQQQQHKKPQQHHRILSGDVYPDETQRPTSYGEVERKLKARGLSIDEPLMDLDTLKLLLEALQLKCLLRKTKQVQVNDPKPSRLRPPTKANYIIGLRNTATARKPEDQRRAGAPPTRSERTRSPRKMKPIAKTEVSERSSMSETAESVNAADKRSSVLERCDFLLRTIAEFNSMPSKLLQQGDQPSPVSVLDSSFYNDDSSSSLSPVMKRTIVFTDDVESVIENEPWTPATAEISDDPDFIYISEILRLTKSSLSEADIFTYLYDQHKNINTGSCKIFKSQRKLVFDTATELIKKHAQLQECVPVSFDKRHPLDLVWSEFKKLRDQETEDEDLIEQIRSLLRKDLWNDLWSGHNVETMVDVERLIFRDLIEETIRDLSRKSTLTSPQPPLRKRLVF